MDKSLYTHRGMWTLWDYEYFKNITTIEEFENTFNSEDDIKKYITLKKIVPIYIHSNGDFQFRVKLNQKLSKREKKYVVLKSDIYMFETDGKAYLSGIEFIDNIVIENEVIELPLKKGRYEVCINLVEWDKEPGMRLEDGSSHPEALPDFIIEVNSVTSKNKTYSSNVHTFSNS